jgi:hypothetical protein
LHRIELLLLARGLLPAGHAGPREEAAALVNEQMIE